MKKQWVVGALIVTMALAGCSAAQNAENEEDNTAEGPEQSEENEESKEEENEESGSKEVSGEADSDDTESTKAEDEETDVFAEAPQTNDRGEIDDPDNTLALVNREFKLPGDYEPDDLTIPDIAYSFEGDHPKKQVREPMSAALEELFAAAEEEGLQLFAVSGYRSYDRQEAIFEANVAEDGEEEANKYSARPGESEHQTGLAMDVSSSAADFGLINAFGETPEGEWLKEHAHEYGFVIRYPEDKTDITGYQYEPWHLRYVGSEAAAAMFKEDITLEEYYQVHDE